MIAVRRSRLSFAALAKEVTGTAFRRRRRTALRSARFRHHRDLESRPSFGCVPVGRAEAQHLQIGQQPRGNRVADQTGDSLLFPGCVFNLVPPRSESFKTTMVACPAIIT